MSVFDKVRTIIASLTGIREEEISERSTMEQLNMNSLDIEELKLEIEEEFGVLFVNNTEVEAVGDIVSYVAAS